VGQNIMQKFKLGEKQNFHFVAKIPQSMELKVHLSLETKVSFMLHAKNLPQNTS